MPKRKSKRLLCILCESQRATMPDIGSTSRRKRLCRDCYQKVREDIEEIEEQRKQREP